jgi:hypothetical protein
MTEAKNQTLLQRLRPAVRPGGLLAIIDVLASPDQAAQPSISLYALGLRLRTSRGGVHPLTAYETWTSSTGFGPVRGRAAVHHTVALAAGLPQTVILEVRYAGQTSRRSTWPAGAAGGDRPHSDIVPQR